MDSEHGFPELQINPGRLDDDEVRQAITATKLAAHEDGAYLILERVHPRGYPATG